MNEVMNLEQLEKLAKNPYYQMSEKQLAHLDSLRRERYGVKHSYMFPKHNTTVKLNTPKIEEPSNGIN